MKGNTRSFIVRSIKLNLFELLKAYSSIIMTKDFQKTDIQSYQFLVQRTALNYKRFFCKLTDWKNLDDLILKNFKLSKI